MSDFLTRLAAITTARTNTRKRLTSDALPGICLDAVRPRHAVPPGLGRLQAAAAATAASATAAARRPPARRHALHDGRRPRPPRHARPRPPRQDGHPAGRGRTRGRGDGRGRSAPGQGRQELTNAL